MLPDMDGFEVCRRIRKVSQVPIIMLTARGEVTDRIVGLELGADDYLPKPFEPRELVVRMQSVSPAHREWMIKLQGEHLCTSMAWRWSLRNAWQFWTVEHIELTTMEYELLVLLMASQPGKVFSRDRDI